MFRFTFFSLGRPRRSAPTLGRLRLKLQLAMLSGLLLGSCGESSPLLFSPASEARPINTGLAEGIVGDPLSPGPGIVVRDARGNPVPGVLVEFQVDEGGGSVEGASIVTDERGEARVGAWILGERPGPNVLVARPVGLGEVRLTALAAPGPPDRLEPVSAMDQAADVGTPVEHPPVVRVRDRFGNPVRGASVTFTVVKGGGEVTLSSILTDAEGLASAMGWTLGLLPGPNKVEASVPGVGVVPFSAEARLPELFNLFVEGVHLNQGGQSVGGGVGGIAGRPGLLRVMVGANSPNAFAPEVRVRFLQGQSVLREVMIPAPRDGVPQQPDLSDLTQTWNVRLEAHEVVEGLSVEVVADPEGTIQVATSEDNRYPREGGAVSLDVQPLSPLRVLFIPVNAQAQGRTGNVHPGNTAQFLDAAMRWIPSSSISAAVRSPYTFGPTLADASNWSLLLSEIQALRVAESAVDEYYLGIVPAFQGMAFGGLAFRPTSPDQPSRSALAHDAHPEAAGTVAHELGHNMGRRHAPCGNPSGVDPAYPYPDAQIGPPSWDVVSGALRSGGNLRDYMSYCGPRWTSDYTFGAILNWRRADPLAQLVADGVTPARAPGPAEVTDGLLLWGRIHSRGVDLNPAFALAARPVLPTEPGPYRLRGVDARGQELFNLSFRGVELSEGPDPSEQHFTFFVPVRPHELERLERIELAGPMGAATRTSRPDGGAVEGPEPPQGPELRIDFTGGDLLRLRWDATNHPMALVRDRRTGLIRTFARGGEALLSAQESAPEELEVILSDGVRSAPASRP